MVGLSGCATTGPERPMPRELDALGLNLTTARVVARYCPTLDLNDAMVEKQSESVLLYLMSQGYSKWDIEWYINHIDADTVVPQVLQRFQDAGIAVPGDTPASEVPPEKFCAYGVREQQKSSAVGEMLL